MTFGPLDGWNPPVFPPMPELKSPAEEAQTAIVARIRAFEAKLGPNEEMAIHLPGSPVGFRLTRVGTGGGGLVAFYGEDEDGRKVEAYQHFMQTSVTLMAVAKLPEREAHRIGFDIRLPAPDPAT